MEVGEGSTLASLVGCLLLFSWELLSVKLRPKEAREGDDASQVSGSSGSFPNWLTDPLAFNKVESIFMLPRAVPKFLGW